MCQRKAHGVEEGYYIRREHGNEMRIKRDEFACEMEEGGDWSLRLRNVEGRVVGLLLSTQPCCLLFAVFCITWDHLLLFASSSSHYSFLSFFSFCPYSEYFSLKRSKRSDKLTNFCD